MGKFIDLKGKKFGMLLVKENANDPYINPTSGCKTQRWFCLCDCGKECVVLSSQLTQGRRDTCGCDEKWIKHGMARTPQYKNHNSMKARCNNVQHESYSDYGGRGISYDPNWESFESFWEDMEEGYAPGLELDRIDVNGNYCKENCRWTDRSVQCFNRRIDKKNTSGKSGVSLDKKSGKWHAYINVRGKRISLKLHDTFEEAVRVRLEAELKYFGETKE